MFVICNCGYSDSSDKKDVFLEVKNQSFEVSVSKLLNSDNHYKPGEWWRAIQETMDFSNPEDIKRWLELQKTILMHPSPNLSSVRQSAIQEFSHFIEYVYIYEDWLMECKEKKVFKNPFIVQNIDMTLDYLRVLRGRGEIK
jgi:hypothetical protein